jgi:hypothetical protein
MYGPAAGALVGGLLGQYKRENPGDPNQAMQMALRGGISGLGANLASGQGLSLGGGMRGAYGLDTFNPIQIGSEFFSDPGAMFLNKDATGLDRFRFMDNFGGLSGSTVAEGSMSFPPEVLETMNKMGVNTSGTLAENAPLLERILGKNKVLELILKGYASKKLGDIIKEENKNAQIAMDEKMKDIGKQTYFDQYASLTGPGELQIAPNQGYADAFVTGAQGGILDMDAGGELKGPGTGTSDSIPAMLSDGEFVMTAKAVRGAGGGDRREGARKMYEAMDNLEAQA